MTVFASAIYVVFGVYFLAMRWMCARHEEKGKYFFYVLFGTSINSCCLFSSLLGILGKRSMTKMIIVI